MLWKHRPVGGTWLAVRVMCGTPLLFKGKMYMARTFPGSSLNKMAGDNLKKSIYCTMDVQVGQSVSLSMPNPLPYDLSVTTGSAQCFETAWRIFYIQRPMGLMTGSYSSAGRRTMTLRAAGELKGCRMSGAMHANNSALQRPANCRCFQSEASFSLCPDLGWK